MDKIIPNPPTRAFSALATTSPSIQEQAEEIAAIMDEVSEIESHTRMSSWAKAIAAFNAKMA